MSGSRPTAATPTPPSAEGTSGCVAVAWSGGRDSTALLHATLAACAPLGIGVVALHVNHRLHTQADAWQQHCEALGAAWAGQGARLVVRVQRIEGAPSRGDSVEAWARQVRYRALRGLAIEAGAALVLLAHHRRDQAETFLLQALRGAGVAGLAGMPRIVERDGITWARPWLDRPREAIEAYVRDARLAYIADTSNDDERYARNRLRAQVWPALGDAFSEAEGSLARSAEWAAQANAVLADVGAEDLVRITDGERLVLARWQRLSPARRANVLRTWLTGRTSRPPAATLLLRLIDEWPPSANGCWPMPEGELRAHRGRLEFVATPHMPRTPRATDDVCVLRIRRAGVHDAAAWGGRLRVKRVREGGIGMDRLACIELRPREGAEQFQCDPGRPPRSLKKQFQAAGVPAWQREGPLVYSEGRLVFVPGLGIDARVLAAPGAPQATLEWCPLN